MGPRPTSSGLTAPGIPEPEAVHARDGVGPAVVAALLVQTAISAGTFLVAKRAVAEAPVLTLVLWRFLLSGAVFALLLVALRGPALPPRRGVPAALALGFLAGPLNRAAFGRDVIDFNADDASETNTGHFIVALDVARFLPLDEYKAEVDRHIRELKESKRLPGVDEIRMPGERRRQCREDRRRNGVPLAAPLVTQLDALAAELGIAPLESRA